MRVKSNSERPLRGKKAIPLSIAVFGSGAFNTQTFNDTGMDVRNMYL